MSELNQQVASADSEYKMPERLADASQSLEQSINKLAKFGGFDFLEAGIDGVQNLNPERKARKKIFLTDADKKTERDDLKKKLLLWFNLLSETSDVNQMVEQCNSKTESASAGFKKNLKKALDATRELEQNYRSVALFYKNSESNKKEKTKQPKKD